VNARGQYGNGHAPILGADLLHTLELRQRYDNVSTVAAGSLLRDLSRDGSLSSTSTNRWEVALTAERAWVLVAWYPDSRVLTITITDRDLRPVDQVAPTRRRYEEILRKITPRLQSFGATIVGAAAYVGQHVNHVNIGLKVFHTLGDSERATRSIDVEMNAIVDAMYRAMGVDPSILRQKFTIEQVAETQKKGKLRGLRKPGDPVWKEPESQREINEWKDRVQAARAKAEQSPLWSFYISAIAPHYDDWMKFRTDEKFDLFTSWEEYEKWLERVRQLRATVKEKGIRIETPDPLDLTKTLPAELAEGALEFGKILKWGVIGVLGIGAVVALSSVVSNLRSGKDPAEKYVEMIRPNRRPRFSRQASHALPEPREQLALSPGESAIEDA
jgi:hypothetical protein